DNILKSDLETLKIEKRESLFTIIAKGNKDDVLETINKHSPIFSEVIALTLEEVFIYEMEAVGYDYNNIIF
ncbi:MAG: ABC transporter ATP-binding protein, partial [Oscillospiraceae bacterium]